VRWRGPGRWRIRPCIPAEDLAAGPTPAGRKLYLAWDQAFDWDPDDPRVEQLADDMIAFAQLYQDQHRGEPPVELDDPVAVALLSHPDVTAPAWERVLQLCAEQGYPINH
jgi:hypothetical protein